MERSGASIALVMELVEGPTLADRITQGAIPVDEVQPIAKQTVEALEAAHEQGIVHRDLKPANIKVRLDRTVKVLDFGLARVIGANGRQIFERIDVTHDYVAGDDDRCGGDPRHCGLHESGAGGGQGGGPARDIWSFGVVLWEMLTGRRLFDGETISHTLADVLRAPIDLTALPPSTPRVVRDLVRRCLDRDVTMRLRDIGEARIALQNDLANPAGDHVVSAAAASATT